jgi:hypothetical protein
MIWKIIDKKFTFTLSMINIVMKKVTIFVLSAFVSSYTFSQNIIINAGFETISKSIPNPKGYCHKPSTNDWAAGTPADNWSAWINNPTENSCMITEVANFKTTNCLPLPPKGSNVGGSVMHIVSTIGHSGVAQNPLPKNNGVKVSCWVYVIRGGMTIGIINSANNEYQKSVASTTICKWEKLTFIYEKPIDNITIYSKWASTQPMADGAEFYIDDVVVERL